MQLKASKRKSAKKGIALIAVLLILSTLMVMTVGFAAFTTVDHKITQAYHTANITFYLAQAGLEYAFYLMKHNLLVYPTFTRNVSGNAVVVSNTNKYFTDSAAGVDEVYTRVGQASNVYNPTGEEHLVISDLAWTSNSMDAEIFNVAFHCGTFNITVNEMQDDAASDRDRRVLYVKSEGKIRLVPSKDSNGQVVDHSKPEDWDFDDSEFKVFAKRTLFMRIPYAQDSTLNVYDSGNTGTEIHYEILTDGWFEKFR